MNRSMERIVGDWVAAIGTVLFVSWFFVCMVLACSCEQKRERRVSEVKVGVRCLSSRYVVYPSFVKSLTDTVLIRTDWEVNNPDTFIYKKGECTFSAPVTDEAMIPALARNILGHVKWRCGGKQGWAELHNIKYVPPELVIMYELDFRSDRWETIWFPASECQIGGKTIRGE